MNAPESHADIESALADAFAKRHAQHRAGRPSLVDVRRRAHRRAARRSTMRGTAVVAAGASVVAGGWFITRGSAAPSAAPGGPLTEPLAPDNAPSVSGTVTLSVDGLWSAVAAQLGTTVEQLRAANPTIDFAAAPAPGTPIVVPDRGIEHTDTTVTWPAVASTVTAVASTVPPPDDPAVTTTVTLLIEPGWMPYVIVTGDYLARIADQFCTTVDELVAGNGWAGPDVPLYPGDLIGVPADAC